MELENLKPWWLQPEREAMKGADRGGYYWLALLFDLEVDSRRSDSRIGSPNRDGNHDQGLARAQMQGKVAFNE